MRRLMFLILASGLLISCAQLVTMAHTSPAKRDVVDNTFTSSYPQLSIKIDSSFDYTGRHDDYKFSPFTSGGESGSGVDFENYCFNNAAEKKAVEIDIATLTDSRASWQPDMNKGGSNLLISDKETKAGVIYQTAVWAQATRDGKCLLVKRLGKIVGAKRNCMVQIFYSHEIKPELGDRNQWRDASLLNSAQRDFLKVFLESADQQVEFE